MAASAADKVLTMNYRPMTADLLFYLFIFASIESLKSEIRNSQIM